MRFVRPTVHGRGWRTCRPPASWSPLTIGAPVLLLLGGAAVMMLRRRRRAALVTEPDIAMAAIAGRWGPRPLRCPVRRIG